MKCSSTNNNQAVCIGGLDPESLLPYNMTDEWSQSVGVIDMTALTLKSSYDADAPPYTAPDIVGRAYDNG